MIAYALYYLPQLRIYVRRITWWLGDRCVVIVQWWMRREVRTLRRRRERLIRLDARVRAWTDRP